MNPLRVGIIGTRASGVERMRALAGRSDVEVVASCRPGPARGVMHFDDEVGLLLRADLDAVIFAGAVGDTARIVSAALGRGLHVLCVRAPGISVEDAIELRQAEAAARGRILQFSFPLHYHGSVATARRLASDHSLGRLLTLRGVYSTVREPGRTGRGGVLFDKGMHMVDLMTCFAGPFTEVKSFVGRSVWGEAGCDDDAFALMRTHDGTVAQLHVSATWWRETFRLELGFEHGYLWLDGLTGADADLAPEVLIVGRLKRDAAGRPMANPEEQVTTFTAVNAVDLELADFIHAVRGRGPAVHGTSAQAFDAMNTIQRLYAADESWLPRLYERDDEAPAAAE